MSKTVRMWPLTVIQPIRPEEKLINEKTDKDLKCNMLTVVDNTGLYKICQENENILTKNE